MDFSGESGNLKNKNLPMEDRLDRSCRKKLDIIRTLTLGKTSQKDLGLCVTWLGILCRAAKKEAQEKDCLMELMLRQLQETGQLSLPFTDITNCVRNLSELLTPEGLGQPQLLQPMVSRENNNDNTQQYQWREKLHQLDQLEVLYKHGELIDSASTTKSEGVRLPAGTEKCSGMLRVKGANEVRFKDKTMPPTKPINKSQPSKPRVSPAEGTSARQRQDRELRMLEINLRKEKERLDREFRAKQREQERAQLAEQIRLDREQLLTGQQVWQQERRRLQEKVQARIEHERYMIRKKREEQREQDERTRERRQRDQVEWKQMHRKRREMERIDRQERARLLNPKEEFVTIMTPKKRMESGELQSAEKVISWMVLCPSCRENVVHIPSQSKLHTPEQHPQTLEEASSKSISQGSNVNIKETRQTKQAEHLKEQPDPDRKKKSRESLRDNRLECDQGTSTVKNIKRIRQLQKEQMIEVVKLIRQSRDDQVQKRVLQQELELKRSAEQANPTARDSKLLQMDQVAELENIQGFLEEQDLQKSDEQSKKKEELELALKKAELMEQQLLQKLEQERKEKEELEKKVAERLENLRESLRSKENKVIKEKNGEIEECVEENIEKSQVLLINSLNTKEQESPSFSKEPEKSLEKIIEEKKAEKGNQDVLENNKEIDEKKQQEFPSRPSPKEKDHNKEGGERDSKKKVKNQENQGDNTMVDENNIQKSPISIIERERHSGVIKERGSKKKNLETQGENTNIEEKNKQKSPDIKRQTEKPFGDRKSQKENQEVLDDDEKKQQEIIPQGSSIPLSLLVEIGRKWEEMERKNEEKREREKNKEKEPKRSIEEKSPWEIEEEGKENYDYERLQKKDGERTEDAIFKRKVEKIEHKTEKGHQERIEKDEEYINALEDKRKAEEKLLGKRAQDNMRTRLHGKSENVGPDALDLKKTHKERLCPGGEMTESKENKKANEENNEFEIFKSNVEDKIEKELRRKVVRRTEAVEERKRVTLEKEEMETSVKKHQQEKESLLSMGRRSVEEASRQEVIVQMERKAQIERRVNEDLEKKAMQELFEAEQEFRKQEQMQVEHLQKMREQSQKGKEEMQRLFQHYTSFWKNRSNDRMKELESEIVQRKPEEVWCQEEPASSPEMKPERRSYSSKDMERNRRVTQGLKKPVKLQLRQMLRNNDYRAVRGEDVDRNENKLRNGQESPTLQQSTSRSEGSEMKIGHRSEPEKEIPPGDVAPKPKNIKQFIQQRRHEVEVSFNKPFAGRFEGGSQFPCYLRHHSPIRELNRQRTEENWLKVDKERKQRVRSIERLDQKLDSERRSLEGDDFGWTQLTDRSQEPRDRPELQRSQPQNFQPGPLEDHNRCFGVKETIRCYEPRVRQSLQRSVHQNYQKRPLRDHNQLFDEEPTPIEESVKEIISSSSSGHTPEIRLSLVGRFCPERRTYIVGTNEKQSQRNRNQGGQESIGTDLWNLMKNSRPHIPKPRQDRCQPYEGRRSPSNTDVTHPGRSLLRSSTKVCNTKCKNFHMAFLESAKRIIAVLRASNANPSSSESSEECARHLGQKLPEPIFRNLAEPLLESSQDLAQNLVAIVSTLDEQLERHVGHLRNEWNCFLDQRRTVKKLQNQLHQAERDQMVASSRSSVFNVLIQWWNLNRTSVNLLKDLFSEYCDLGDPLVKETLDTIEWFYGEWSLQKLVFEHL
ncbi:trichohyalin [Drosophila bipectinata]|uniref:trichohyalin n=1 Tax=Drosophila bipectinata TaxID=42026 RepID=UPI0038B2D0AE